MSNEIKWTEKVQAFAGIIAIIGGIAGFYTLFSSDDDIQDQITNLTIMAEQSKKQTKILQNQLNAFYERNKILIEQLDIDKEKWIMQIRPEFTIEGEDCVGGTNVQGGYTLEGLQLVNKGSSAFILKFEVNKGNQCKIDIQPEFVPKTGSSELNLIFQKDRDAVDFNLIYKDIEGNIYTQRFSGQANYNKININSEEPKTVK